MTGAGEMSGCAGLLDLDRVRRQGRSSQKSGPVVLMLLMGGFFPMTDTTTAMPMAAVRATWRLSGANDQVRNALCD